MESDNNAILRKAARRIRREPFEQIDPIRRLLESRNKNTRQIADAAVDFLAFGENPLSPAWVKSSTWAKVMKAGGDHSL